MNQSDPSTVPVLVTAERLDAAPAPVLCDVRWYLDGRNGVDAYRAGHVPGAVFIDLDRWLAAPASASEGRHPLPDPRVFAEGMSLAGIAHGTPVVAYDDQAGMVAARLVWMLRALGQPASLLDGGLDAYEGLLETGEVLAAPTTFQPIPWPDGAIASIDEVAELAAGSVLIDARAPQRFRGEVEPVDPRAGHIPGARNAPFADNLDDTGRFLDPTSLASRFRDVGIGDHTDVVVYCGSGVSACHDLLAIEAAGLGRHRLYVGSWSQWSSDPDRPASTG